MSQNPFEKFVDLDNFSSFDQKVLAVVALDLLNCINHRRLVANGQLAADELSAMLLKINGLYLIQDILHGESDPDRALAALSAVCGIEVAP